VALAEKNIFDVTVDDIVRKAGVARGTFYIYFTDKFDLLRALTEQLVEEQVDELAQVRGKYESKLEELEESALRAIKRWEANAPVYRAVFQLAMIREDFHDLRDQLQIPLRAREAAEIQEQIDAGRARNDIDARVVAAAKNRMYELIVMEWFGWGKPPYEGATVPA
jgi:AcrR family transcriptional regulator